MLVSTPYIFLACDDYSFDILYSFENLGDNQVLKIR